MSPTERVLKICRERGYEVNVVEKWNPFAGRRIDLFGIFDLVAVTQDCILGLQTTSAAHHADHRAKMCQNAILKRWRGTGSKALLITFGKSRVNGKVILRSESVPDGKIWVDSDWPKGFSELIEAEQLKRKNKNARKSGKPLVFTEGQRFERGDDEKV